jgi:hypothetical protein
MAFELPERLESAEQPGSPELFGDPLEVQFALNQKKIEETCVRIHKLLALGKECGGDSFIANAVVHPYALTRS